MAASPWIKVVGVAVVLLSVAVLGGEIGWWRRMAVSSSDCSQELSQHAGADLDTPAASPQPEGDPRKWVPSDPKTAELLKKVNVSLPLWWHEDSAWGRSMFRRANAHNLNTSAVKELKRSQVNSEEVYAFTNFFYGKVGTVLEFGAIDGVDQSTTLVLEQDVGWRAVHIEGSPSSFNGLYGNRPNAVNINAAVCNDSRMIHYVEYGYSHHRGIAEFMSGQHVQNLHPELLEQWKSGIYTTLPATPCLPLTALLRSVGLTHFNLWILDVEGAEFQVLQSIDWSVLSFDVICAEASLASPGKNVAVIDTLEAQGFRWITRFERNDWFVHKDYKPSRRPDLID